MLKEVRAMLKKSLSMREKILLAAVALLLLVAVYVLAVAMPVNNGISSAQTQIEDTQMNIDLLTAKAMKRKAMLDELEVLKASDDIQEVPAYDNLPNVIKFHNSVLGNATDYQMKMNSVSAPAEGDGIVRRTAQLSFKCNSYSEARAAIQKLEGSNFIDRVTNLVISPVDSTENDVMNAPVEVAASITFFERLA